MISWLEVTAELQNRYGYSRERLADPDKRRIYICANLASAFVELGEVGQEVDFRPWKSKDHETYRVIDEVVDVMHHLANILYVHGVTDDEFWSSYMRKVEHNRTRTDHKRLGA